MIYVMIASETIKKRADMIMKMQLLLWNILFSNQKFA